MHTPKRLIACRARSNAHNNLTTVCIFFYIIESVKSLIMAKDPDPIPIGFIEDFQEVVIAAVSETIVAHELVELKDGTEYIIKEVEGYFDGVTTALAKLHLNTANDDAAATRFGSRLYRTGFFINFTGNKNGIINGPLTAKPYLLASAGTASVEQTVEATVHYYYKPASV